MLLWKRIHSYIRYYNRIKLSKNNPKSALTYCFSFPEFLVFTL